MELANPVRADAGLAPWLCLALAIGLALAGQALVADGRAGLGLAGLIAAALAAAYGARAPLPPALLPAAPPRPAPARWRAALLALAALCAALAFALSGGNRYRPANVLPWLTAVAAFWAACADWPAGSPAARLAALRAALTPGRLALAGLLAGALALGAVFRFAELFENPLDMNSDQAEKLLDVGDILAGTNPIFFERNTGREPWQFYWTAALIRLLGLAPDFMALKIGTALIGWLMLPAIFLLAREVLGSRGALLAVAFAAVSSWGVITARYGLRYPLAPCAVAWTLAHLVRGLRRGSRNELLLAGAWAGVGLQGYTAYRLMLLVGPLLAGLWCAWLLYRRQPGLARRALAGCARAAILAALVALPLIRYGVDHPDRLLFRAATRLSGLEAPIPGDPLQIFVWNLGRALLMFNYTGDEVWVANLAGRPALDYALGGLLAVGAVACLALSWRRRSPWPALTLLAGMAMLVPSALSIAFPRENPSVVRAGGALPALMVVCAAGPAALLEAARGRPRRHAAALAGAAALLLLVVGLNRERVFVTYPAEYCRLAQNAHDIAAELRAWEAAGGRRGDAWLVGFPHWVDTRAVGVWIGEISFPNSVTGPEQATAIDFGGRPGWLALNVRDVETLRALQARYPAGRDRLVPGSRCEGRDFVVFETRGLRGAVDEGRGIGHRRLSWLCYR